ncbi:SDR family NAD(P)-dependent oxidoreductase [Dactylosporangium sp. NPDC048998]|uniref:SDR family NAD(P)-dependent oxidoreductase n=1 Tax=Dactylosporangium sp. NPDC048998 TaxID=3363976 RepID=UPI00372215E1
MNTTDDLPLAGRVAVVSGAGAGLGRAHARTLAAMGASVVINDLPVPSDADPGVTIAEAVAAEIRAVGGAAIAVHASVADAGAGERIVEKAIDAFSRVDIVVNNAGILRDGPLRKRDRADWEAVIGVHVHGAYELTRAAWPYMLDAGFGRVVVTSSAAGIYGTANNASYGTAKMGVVGMARMLAAEAAGTDINVNAIAPLALTAMSSSGGDRDRAADVIGDLFQRMPAEQVSQTVGWLCHPDCDVTGRIFAVGGGRVAEVLVTETRGWVRPGHTWRDVRDNWDSVTDRGELHVPVHISDELQLFMAVLG